MPQGLIVDLITPFREDGSIDGRGLGRHLDRVLPYADGLFLASPTMGEGSDLDPSRRQEILEIASVIVRGRIPILIWISQRSEAGTRETLRILNEGLERRKYEGPVFWVDTPLYYHSNRGLPDLYRDLQTVAKRPIILHNDPELVHGLGKPLKRGNIRTAILKELVGLEAVVGLIFLGSMEMAYHYQRASRLRSGFQIYDGDEARFPQHPSTGGVVSAGANLAPRGWGIITRASLHGTSDENDSPDHLRQIWELGQYLRELKESYAVDPPRLIKEALWDLKIVEGPPAPFPSGHPEEGKKLKELLRVNHPTI